MTQHILDETFIFEKRNWLSLCQQRHAWKSENCIIFIFPEYVLRNSYESQPPEIAFTSLPTNKIKSNFTSELEGEKRSDTVQM